MRLKAGKYYLGEDGKKYGPVIEDDGFFVEQHSSLWREDGTGVGNYSLIAEWTEDPETLTVARVDFNGGDARVILSNGMELGGVTHVEAAAGVDEITLVGIIAHVDNIKKEPFSEYGNYGENNGPV